MSIRSLLVCGGAGFIGSHFLRLALNSGYKVICLDALTYSGNIQNLEGLSANGNFEFVHGNICDRNLVNALLTNRPVSGVINFAAESHVDRSISSPNLFYQTNVLGTVSLLEATQKISSDQRRNIRFLQVSTDEVFGELDEQGRFDELTPYQPNSPYSSSKAAADHAVRAWHRTYGLDTVITISSNNWGIRQHPEKLIPKMITEASEGRNLPVYGNGKNIRDWIWVEDNCHGILLAFEKGRSGESYCLGGDCERRNIDLIKRICDGLDKIHPRPNGRSYFDLATFVPDRPGHDLRYALDSSKAKTELGFSHSIKAIEFGIDQVISWYLQNTLWVQATYAKTSL